MSLNYVLALKSCSTLSEFILKSPDLQWWTPAERKKHFYLSGVWISHCPSQVCWGSEHFQSCCRDQAVSSARNMCWDVENTHHQSKNGSRETFPGGMDTQGGNSCPLGACRECKAILCLSSCAMIAPSTAGNEKDNPGKAVTSQSLDFFPNFSVLVIIRRLSFMTIGAGSCFTFWYLSVVSALYSHFGY